jgi:hypothetical protein
MTPIALAQLFLGDVPARIYLLPRPPRERTMISLLGRWRMFDELPRQDRVVCTVFDYFGLGWLLLVPEALFVFGAAWWKTLFAIAFGVFCVWFAHYWPVIKPKLGPVFVTSIVWATNSFWLKRVVVVVLLGYIVALVLSFAFQLRRDLDSYVMPRQVTGQQTSRLCDFLSHHDSFSVGVRVADVSDQESSDYAGQLFNALRKSKLDVNPPNHDGPGPVRLREYMPRPSKTDTDRDGSPLFKSDDAFMEAQDAWIDAEIRWMMDSRFYQAYGLNIMETIVGAAVNPDPLHPSNVAILQDALRYAGIDANGGGSASGKTEDIYLLVGRRPMKIGYEQPILLRFGRWIERVGAQ